MGRRRPYQLQTDRGKEFYNQPFQRFLKHGGIHHFSTHRDAKAVVGWTFQSNIERENVSLFHRGQYMKVHRRVACVNARVQCQSSSKHWNGSPRGDIPKQSQVWQTLYGSKLKWKTTRKPSLKVGDRVRLSKHVRTFKKGYLPSWTEEVFVVLRFDPGIVPTYKVDEFDKTPLEGTFHEQELQRAKIFFFFGGGGGAQLGRASEIYGGRKIFEIFIPEIAENTPNFKN